MNVLHVTPSMSPAWGGPVVVVSELIPALADQNINCEILTTRGHRVGSDIIEPSGIPTHVFDTGLPARLWTAYSRELSAFLDENIARFDLVHIHEVWHYAGYVASRAARKRGIPYIVTIHGELSEWSFQHKGWKKLPYRKAALDKILKNAFALHAITQAEKERIAELGYDTPVMIAPNGIDPTPFDKLPDPSAFLEKYPALEGKRVILFMGRLNPKKGLDILAHSFSTLRSRFPDAVLLIAGPDEEGTRQKTETILRSEGTLDSVIFTGMLTGKDKLAAMSCAEVFILPSYSDVLGIAVLEAMAARLPVVITDRCEFPEVAEYNAGLVVRPIQSEVADSLTLMLADPILRARMGRCGRKLVADSYTWPSAASSLSTLYRSSTAHV